MLKRLSYTTAVGLLLATAFAAAQTGQPPAGQGGSTPAPEVTFRVEVNYVEEDVRVVDRDGNFVKGLTLDDFQLFEDGTPQKISAFGMVDIPLTPLAKPVFLGREAIPIDPDVASNEQALDGRLYLVLLDDFHVNPLRTQAVRNLVRRFVLEKMGPNDRAAIMTTSGASRAVQDFTENRRLLVEAINRFVGKKMQSATLGRAANQARDEYYQMQANENGSPDPITPNNLVVEDVDAQERMYNARAALNSLRGISEWMAAIQGRRKAIVYISEGVDYNVWDMFTGNDATQFSFENSNMIQQETWDTISAAGRSNVQIYPIDPRGLTNMADEDIELGAQPQLGGRKLGPQSFAHELLTAQLNLRQLAEETGGVAAVGTNDLNGALDRIVEENSSYYVLGYYPSNERRDGKLRKVVVKVNGYPDAQVTFRKRYVAARGRAPNTTTGKSADPAAELAETLASPLPKTGLPLRVTAVPRKGEGKTTDLEVLVDVGGKDMAFTERDGTFENQLSLSVGLFDKDGKSVAAERPDVTMTLKPPTYERVLASGIRVLRHVSVPPGRYQLRIAAQDSAKTKQGSAHLDIDVPDFSKEPIMLSGIALATTADPSPSIWTDPFGGGLPGPPTALREFPVGAEIALFLEVYDNKPTPVHRLDITTTVRATDGRVVFTSSDERTTEDLQGRPGGFGYAARVPTIGWTPGLYVLSVAAQSRTGNAEPVTRLIQFRVR